MEKIPNLNIGNQEFQKVGKMESEPTRLKHAPENYNLYQDTESGALMGELQSLEIYEKLPGIDLTQLTPNEVFNLLTAHRKGIGMSLLISDLQIFGTICGVTDKGNLSGEMAVVSGFDYPLREYYFVTPKSNNDLITGKSNNINDAPSYVRLSEDELSEATRKLTKGSIRILGPNSISINEIMGGSARISFMEIPEGYKELMEKKEGKAE